MRYACMSVLALAAIPLGACVESRSAYAGYPSDVITSDGYYFTYEIYYDGHYGPIHDGYWGSDSHFYFRSSGHEKRYRQGARQHFRMTDEMPPSARFHREQVILRAPQHARLPHFDGASRGMPYSSPSAEAGP